jgi:hypothetical protein
MNDTPASQTNTSSAPGGRVSPRAGRRGRNRKLRREIQNNLTRLCRIDTLSRELQAGLLEITVEGQLARQEALEVLDATREEGGSPCTD